MDCRKMNREELVEKYLRGQLDSAAQDECEMHLLECAGCQQALEIVQGITNVLAERAHEIRDQTPVRSGWLRWRWAALAWVLVVVGSLAVLQLQHHFAPPQGHALPTTAGRPEAGKGAETSASESSTGAESGTSIPPAAGRNAVESAHLGQTTTLSAVRNPSAKQATNGLSATRAEAGAAVAKSHESPAPPMPAIEPSGDEVVLKPQGSDGEAVVGGVRDRAGDKGDKSVDEASDKAAKELFRLGTVQPPPYTFSGVAVSGKGGKTFDAKSATQGHTTRSPDAAREWFKTGMEAYVARQYTQASENLENAVKLEPKAADANFFLGVCKLLLGDPVAARAPLQKASENEKSPWAQPAHYYLAKAYAQTGDLAQAETQFAAAAAMTGRLTAEAGTSRDRTQALRHVQPATKPVNLP